MSTYWGSATPSISSRWTNAGACPTNFRPSRLPATLGNHVIVRPGDVYAAFVHLAPGTVAVVDGQSVSTGDVIGRIGHTGNSTSPTSTPTHDPADAMPAQGIVCGLRAQEVERDGSWIMVTNGIPGRRNGWRSIEPDIDASR